MSITGIEEDAALLRDLAKHCKDAKERERLRALYVVSIGEPVERVARFFCVDEATIYRWIERWKKERHLKDRPKDGRPPTFGREEKEEVKRLLIENDPGKHGINASAWDCRELQRHFARNDGKRVSRETIRRCLHELGAHYVKANLRYPEADEEEQAEFARDFFEQQTEDADVVILFEDEMGTNCSPRKGYGWTLEKRLVVQAPQRQRTHLTCFGAVNPRCGEVIQLTSREAKAHSFIRLLRKVEKRYPGRRVVIYTDNLSVHKSKVVKRFFAKRPHMRHMFLPKYSPELNPQEQWWNFQRRKLLNNRSFDTPHKLSMALSSFVRNTLPEEIMSICSLAPIENLVR